MCSHYQGIKERERYIRQFGVEPPGDLGKYDLWPGYLGSFVRRHPNAVAGDAALHKYAALNGRFGLMPHWSTDTTITKHTYNARSETVAEKPSFRDAWKRGQHCIIPADAIFEPDWRSGKAIATRIARKDGEPMGIAGLWSCWTSPKGDVFSYTMLTIHADTHELMRQFHKPVDATRMVVILEPDRYASWLSAPSDSSMDFMQPYPANLLTASAPTPVEGVLF